VKSNLGEDNVLQTWRKRVVTQTLAEHYWEKLNMSKAKWA